MTITGPKVERTRLHNLGDILIIALAFWAWDKMEKKP